MIEQSIVNNLVVRDKSLHSMCMRLGGITLGKYTMLTGEKTAHFISEFEVREALSKRMEYGKN